MECEYCKSVLKTLSSLNYHKKNNKKCLDIQKTINSNIKIESCLIQCKFCEKSFTSTNFDRHSNKCKEKNKKELETSNEKIEMLQVEIKNITTEYQVKINDIKKEHQNEIQELKNYIIKLETMNDIYGKDRETINDIAKQPKNTNNIINNLSVFEDKLITDRFCLALSNIKPSDFYDGQQSIGRIVAPCLQNEDGTKMITCTDYSRGIFLKKDKHGNLNKDIKCRNLVDIIEPLASAKADELIKEDSLKRIKSYELKSLEDKIINRETEIENLEQTLLGYKKGSKKWSECKNLIIKKENENEKDLETIEKLKNDGVNAEINDNIFDSKLLEAADDIKEMKKDSSKFSKTLSEFV